MQHFTTGPLLFHLANEAIRIGAPREDIAKLAGVDITKSMPGLFTRINIEHAYALYKVLHDYNYQAKYELLPLSNVLLNGDIHTAFFANAPDLNSLLQRYIFNCMQHSTSIRFKQENATSSSTFLIDFIENKADFFVPQNFFTLLFSMIKKIFNLNLGNNSDVVLGITQHRIPDLDRFSVYATDRVQTKATSAYIRLPNSLLTLKNPNFNPLLDEYIIANYNQAYGIVSTADKIIQQVSQHISAVWSEGKLSPNISTIAERLGMSRSKLYRELAQRNMTFSAIIESQRQQFAMEQIKNRDISIAEISDRLGYANVSAFTRAFNRWFNMNPSKMRQ